MSSENSLLLDSSKSKLDLEDKIEDKEFFNTRLVLLWVMAGLVIPVLVLLIVFPGTDTAKYEYLSLSEGTKIYLSSLQHSLYVRSDKEGLYLTDSIPWAHGSAFEVYPYDENCFQLRSSSNTWVRFDYRTGDLLNDGIIKTEGTYFSLVKASPSSILDNPSITREGRPIHLKVCHQELWFEVQGTSSLDHRRTSEPQIPALKVALTKQSLESTAIFKSFRQNEKSTKSATESLRTAATERAAASAAASTTTIKNFGSVFYMEEVPTIYGVNLGGWFIPEVWMNPALYNGTGLGWGGSLCRYLHSACW